MNNNTPHVFPPQNPRPAHARTERRGIAMILVLISISVAIVIAGVALSTRDTSSAIGANASSNASATWAAESAANVAATVISKNIADWTDSVTTEMMTDWDFADAEVDVVVTNLEGNEPTADDEILRMTVTATVDGITKEIVKEIAVTQSVEIDGAADPWLKEFAIFAATTLNISDNAKFRVWDMSPKSSVSSSVKIGGEFASISDVVMDSSEIVGAEFYPTEDSASTVIDTISDETYNGGWAMPTEIPVYPAAMSTALKTTPSSGDAVFDDGGVTTVDGATDPHTHLRDLEIKDHSTLLIQGDVEIYIERLLCVRNNAHIQLADGATLKIFVGEQIEIDNNAFVGLPEGMTAYADMNEYVSAENFWLITLDPAQGGAAAPTIDINNNAFFKGCVHAPTAEFELSNTALFIGRVTANRVAIGNSRFLYDPQLDNGAGFTNSEGPLYDQDTLQPVAGLETAITDYDWTLGMTYFKSWIDQEVADSVDSGTSGGVRLVSQKATDLDNMLSKTELQDISK